MSRDRPPSASDRGADREDSYDRTGPDDLGAADPADDSFLTAYVPYGWPSFGAGGTMQEDTYGETDPPGEGVGDERDETLLDEGLITLVILGGVALLLFPEPATSGIGVLLILGGAIAWLVDWAT